MAKLSIKAAPTFKATVSIPVAGGAPVDVEFTFKHRTKDEMKSFLESRDGLTDVDTLLQMVDNWDFAEAFTRESAEEMLQNYLGAAVNIYVRYVEELTKAKTKN